jgi:hypothetical protein
MITSGFVQVLPSTRPTRVNKFLKSKLIIVSKSFNNYFFDMFL